MKIGINCEHIWKLTLDEVNIIKDVLSFTIENNPSLQYFDNMKEVTQLYEDIVMFYDHGIE